MKKNFIVFEGLDGSGTTTQAKLLEQALTKLKYKVFLTHEPTDNPIGRLIRSYLQKKSETTSEALALLYSADRNDHLYNKEYGLYSHLEKGEVVISDRYYYSTMAYQGASGLKEDFLKTINNYPSPEAVIFLDTKPSECIKRIDKRGEEKELFDKQEFLEKVRKTYYSILLKEKDTKVFIVDGNKSEEDVASDIILFLKASLKF